mmetsp:Transcript_9424/g.17767  ORF Transcript_9424/g.17767 Transcript_9424/m.17767 type:complete len:146 (-) Transcript_9424:2576-3013(-)
MNAAFGQLITLVGKNKNTYTEATPHEVRKYANKASLRHEYPIGINAKSKEMTMTQTTYRIMLYPGNVPNLNTHGSNTKNNIMLITRSKHDKPSLVEHESFSNLSRTPSGSCNNKNRVRVIQETNMVFNIHDFLKNETTSGQYSSC